MDIEKELVNLNQNKMTPVETLLDWLGKNHYYIGNDLLEKVEELKQLEKARIIDFAYYIADDLACGVYREKKAMEERYNEFLTYREEDDDI